MHKSSHKISGSVKISYHFYSGSPAFRIHFLSLLLFLIVSGCNRSSDKNEGNKADITTYYLYCDSLDFQRIYDEWETEIYIPVTLKYDDVTYNHLRMRLRGDTSKELPKKSLKIKSDGGNLPPGKSSINLNAEYTDKSMIRQALSSRLFKATGEPCFTAGYAEVYLNDKFLGLYLEVENMDELFLKRNGFDPSGNLYKATKDGACLSIYDDFEEDWENKTKKKRKFSDLELLVEQINTVPEKEFPRFLKNTFDYDNLINLLAMNMYIANGSTYYHNYHLFHDITETGKWFIFPWDLDKTISYYNWKPYVYHSTSSNWESDNALVERCFLNPIVFEDIRRRLEYISTELFTPQVIDHLVDSLVRHIEPVLMNDTTNRIENVDQWRGQIQAEKEFIKNHGSKLFKQFDEYPAPFMAFGSIRHAVDQTRISWQKTKNSIGSDITYSLRYSEDFLLPDSTSTVVNNLSDTVYTIENLEPQKKYYWQVWAHAEDKITEAFNSRNVIYTSARTSLTGVINTDTRLQTKNSPYVVEGKLKISPGASLSAEPGTLILMKPESEIIVEGTLMFEGTVQEPVIIKPELTGDIWGSIGFYSSTDSSALRYIELHEGSIAASGTKLSIENSKFYINYKSLEYEENEELIRKSWFWMKNVDLRFNNNQLFSNGTGEGLNIFNSTCIVSGNYITGAPDAIELIGCNNSEVFRNQVHTTKDDAVDLNDCHDVKIYENILVNIADKGISVGSEQYGFSENIRIYDNIILNAKTGVALKDSSFADIHSNYISGTERGLALYQKKGMYEQGGTAKVGLNIFSGVKQDVLVDEFSQLTGNPGTETEACDLTSFNRHDFRIPDTCLPPNLEFHPNNTVRYLRTTASTFDKCCGYVIQNPNGYSINIGGYHIFSGKYSVYKFPAQYVLPPYRSVIVGECKKGHIPAHILYLPYERLCQDEKQEFHLKTSSALY